MGDTDKATFGEVVEAGRQHLIDKLTLENAKLRTELWEQWELNHSEYCDNRWPHPDRPTCFHPPPAILSGYSSNGDFAASATRRG